MSRFKDYYINESFRLFDLDDNEEIDLKQYGFDVSDIDKIARNIEDVFDVGDTASSDETDDLVDMFSDDDDQPEDSGIWDNVDTSEFGEDDVEYDPSDRDHDEEDDILNGPDYEPQDTQEEVEDDDPVEDELLDATPEDPNFDGNIRTVKGACLVYKRLNNSNMYEELWVFTKPSTVKEQADIRRAILAGTDIDLHSGRSEDGSQGARTKAVGNTVFIEITGLPN